MSGDPCAGWMIRDKGLFLLRDLFLGVDCVDFDRVLGSHDFFVLWDLVVLVE